MLKFMPGMTLEIDRLCKCQTKKKLSLMLQLSVCPLTYCESIRLADCMVGNKCIWLSYKITVNEVCG
jgi:hypothetical protein